MGLQHCTGGEVGFLNTVHKTHITLCHQLSEI